METGEPARRAWITGSGGLIGNCLARTKTPEAAGFRIISLKRSDLDLTDFAAVEKRFSADRPDLILHCAAMTRVSDCEGDPKLANKINVEATANLAALAADGGFIFFSTDLAFDGRKGNYFETDPVNPQSVYAETKVRAEQILLKNPRHTVVRTSLNSGKSPKGGTAYNEIVQVAWSKGQTLNLFFDEFRSPIPASVTAKAAWELAAKNAGGLYHLAGSERLSRVALGELSAKRHPELPARINACSLKDYQGPPRPPDVSLNSSKVQKILSFPLPGLTQFLDEHPDEPF